MTAPYFPPFDPRVPTAQEFGMRLDAAPEPAPPGLLARLFGGSDPMMGGLLAPGQARDLSRNALVNAGLSTIEASRGGGRAILPILAQGVRGGQAAYQQGFESSLKNAETAHLLKQRQDTEQLIREYSGRTDPASLTELMGKLAVRGRWHEASALSEYLKSLTHGQAATPKFDLRVDEKGNYVYLPEPGNPSGVVQTGVAAPPPPPQLMWTNEGLVAVDRPRGGGGRTRAVAAPSGEGPLQPKPTEYQTKQASWGTRILEGSTLMADFEAKDPTIGQRVDAKVRALLVAEGGGILGNIAGRAALPLINASLTPDEQAYWTALQDVVNPALREATGAQLHFNEYDKEYRPLIALTGDTEGTVAQKRRRRFQKARLTIHNARSAFEPDILSPRARTVLDSLNAQPKPASTGDDNPFAGHEWSQP